MADYIASAMDCNDSLLSQIAQLEAELEDKQNDLYTAAELGKKLLDANQELQNQLEQNAKEYTEKIELLEQERYTLQMKLDRQKATYEAINQELESTSNQLVKTHALELKHTNQTLSKKIHDISALNEDLKSENEKLELQIQTYTEKLSKQEQTIEQLQCDFRDHENVSSIQQELQDLEQLYAQEKVAKQKMELNLVDLEGKLEVLSMTNSSLQQRLLSLEEECQERCKMANEWYDKLKEANDLNAGLSSQLETLKLELRSENHHKSGNSLFSEVDDRRLGVERKMLSLQVKYDSLVKIHATTTQHFKKMKAEMSALLCRCAANTAHAAQVQRLQQALAQSKSETQDYMSKLHKSEKRLVGVNFAEERRRFAEAFVDFGNKAKYVQFLEKELEQAKNEHMTVLKELDLKRTQLLWESNKLSETEAKLYHSEQEQVKHKKEVTRLRIKMQETMEKLDQAKAAYKQLESDKKFLEDHLKLCRKSIPSYPKENVTSSDSHSKSCLTTCNHQPEKAAGDKGRENCGDDSEIKIRRKEINILEELDHEFNVQIEKKLTLESEGNQETQRTVSGQTCMPKSGSVRGFKKIERQLTTVRDNSINQCPQQ